MYSVIELQHPDCLYTDMANLPIRARILQSPLHHGPIKLNCFSILHFNGGSLEGEGVGVRGSASKRNQGRGRTLLELRWVDGKEKRGKRRPEDLVRGTPVA